MNSPSPIKLRIEQKINNIILLSGTVALNMNEYKSGEKQEGKKFSL